MRFMIQLIIPTLLLAAFQARAAEITALADCANKVFTEINQTQKWSGKAPAGCSARIAVEKRPTGVFVTAWSTEAAEGGWIRTAFSAGMGYAEIARKKVLAAARQDILKRAGHLGRCLESINSVNDPLDCRDSATKSYLVGEETGIENKRLIWLDDNGRHTVAEFAFGDTDATPTPPADLMGGQPLLPGMIINLHIIDDQSSNDAVPAVSEQTHSAAS